MNVRVLVALLIFPLLLGACAVSEPAKVEGERVKGPLSVPDMGHDHDQPSAAVPVGNQSEAKAAVTQIGALLDNVVENYRAGNNSAAAEMAARAYLDGYEVIEDQVIEAAPDINEELEPLLGADLRKEIRSGAPVEEIEQMVKRAKKLLAQAVKAIEAQ